MFEKLRAQVEDQGAKLEVLGVGTTGYAKDILKDVLHADVALVETVAHTESAMRFYDDPHVIVDVGGQDIKLIVLKNGRVKDFKLNTQCSAGNGYFLQSTAETFGIPIEQFADQAFAAQSMPVFGYGCAVFMQSDIVNFQRQGWQRRGDPRRAWRRCCRRTCSSMSPAFRTWPISARGSCCRAARRTTSRSSRPRWISSTRASARPSERPEIIVHEHCGESGAIGAAIEAVRLWKNGRADHASSVSTPCATFTTAPRATKTPAATSARTTACAPSSTCGPEPVAGDGAAAPTELIAIGESRSRCPAPAAASCSSGCGNQPSRRPARHQAAPDADRIRRGLHRVRQAPRAEVPGPQDQGAATRSEQRLIIATCEKGTVEDVEEMKGIKGNLDAARAANPNFVEIASREVFQLPRRRSRGRSDSSLSWWQKRNEALKQRIALMQNRKDSASACRACSTCTRTRRCSTAISRRSGIPSENIVYSDYTSSDLYRAGANRGAIDPCFPAKIGLSHVHNLLMVKSLKKKIDVIFYPMFDVLTTKLVNLQGSNACPTITASPETVKAAFTKESDVFAEHGHDVPRPDHQPCRPEAVRAADVRVLRAAPRAERGGERPRGRVRARAARPVREGDPPARLARCSTSWSARTASASSCWRACTTTIRA